MARTGRPSSYSPELADTICTRISNGETLSAICREDGMPHISTILGNWMNRQDFVDKYARAKEQRLVVMAEEIIQISDDHSKDYIPNEDGRLVPDKEHIQRSRLRVDTRKWLLARLAAKVYGDRQAVEHTGPDGNKLEIIVRRVGD